MRVLGIMGSPRRHSNTEILLDKALEGASDAGAEIEKVLAQKLLAFIPPAPELFDLAARERRPAILTQPKGPYASALRELVEALA